MNNTDIKFENDIEIKIDKNKFLKYNSNLKIEEIIIALKLIKVSKSFSYLELSKRFKCNLVSARQKINLVTQIQITELFNNSEGIEINLRTKFWSNNEGVIEFEVHDDIDLENLVKDIEKVTK
ncbi:MAG: hypothetical protein ACRC1T_03320 [Clostridium chrysemydis]|uniref:hypothetical protein n=1 Tax=Clostridium chrysemydis TaxID=2665504 RepID=UPI003F40DBAC